MTLLSYVAIGMIFCDILKGWMKSHNIIKKDLSGIEYICYGLTWPIFPFVVIMFILFKGKK